MAQKYAVMIVPDGALPSDVKRVIVERTDQSPLLLLAESIGKSWWFISEWERLYADDREDRSFHLKAV